MDERLAHAPVVQEFARAVQPVAGVLGLYVGGSLAARDFLPASSDLDLVAVIAEELCGRRRAQLTAFHTGFRRRPGAARLHCVYVPRLAAGDVEEPHLTWAHGELYRRPLSGIGRAELLDDGIIVLGPEPGRFLPPVTDAALREAARAELTGYWSGAVRRPWLWLDDVHVDLGLLTLARAKATMQEGRLITKSEAVTRFGSHGVDDDLAQQIAARRQGRVTRLTAAARVRRAYTARRLVARGIQVVRRS